MRHALKTAALLLSAATPAVAIWSAVGLLMALAVNLDLIP